MANLSPPSAPCVQILRLPQVCKVTGLRRSMIYQLEAQRRFPGRVRIGARAVGWVEAEVQGWLAGRIKHHRAGGGCKAAPTSPAATMAMPKSRCKGAGGSKPEKALNKPLVDSQLFLFAGDRLPGQPLE